MDAEKDQWGQRLTRLLDKGLEPPEEDVSCVMASRALEKDGVPVVRKHVKVWERYVDWLVATYEASWPEKLYHFQDYLVVRSMKPCDDGVLHSMWRTLKFMEETGGVPEDSQRGEVHAGGGGCLASTIFDSREQTGRGSLDSC